MNEKIKKGLKIAFTAIIVILAGIMPMFVAEPLKPWSPELETGLRFMGVTFAFMVGALIGAGGWIDE